MNSKLFKWTLLVGPLLVLPFFNNCVLRDLSSVGAGATAVGNPKKKEPQAQMLAQKLCSHFVQCGYVENPADCQSEIESDPQTAELLGVEALSTNTLGQAMGLESDWRILVNAGPAESCLLAAESQPCPDAVGSRPTVGFSVGEATRAFLKNPQTRCDRFYRNADAIYTIGGEQGTFLSDIFQMDLRDLTWAKVGRLTQGVSYHRIVSGSSSNFLIGGWNGQSASSAIYSSQNNREWQAFGDLPKALVGFDSIRYQNQIWIIGGAAGRSMPVGSQLVYRSSDLKTFEVAPDLPEGRFGHRAFAFAGDLYVLGGQSDRDTVHDTIYRLDVSLMRWKAVGRLPEARTEAIVHRVGDRIFLIGGYNSALQATDTIFVSQDGINWTLQGQYPKDFAGGHSWVVDGYTYVYSDASIYRTSDFLTWKGVVTAPVEGSLMGGFAGLLTDWTL